MWHNRFTMTPLRMMLILAVGFSVTISVLWISGRIVVREVRGIRGNVSELAREQVLVARLVNDIQLEENAMTGVILQISQGAARADESEALFRNLHESASALVTVAEEARDAGGDTVWVELEGLARAFREGVQAAATGDKGKGERQLDSLFAQHRQLMVLVNRIIREGNGRLENLEARLDEEARGLHQDVNLLFLSGVALAAVSALFTVGFAWRGLHRIQWQADELNRVSWQMLRSQEEVARRFAHELHDELGQSLASLRTNLSKDSVPERESLHADRLALVDECIANVRELSQLLRPVVLDDFGLDAGLRWLVEKFAQRTRLDVRYESGVDGRFSDECETHLFRIAQEALANVARHSAARRVVVRLGADSSALMLSIDDDGRGLPERVELSPGSVGMGMVGMRARARQIGGELTVTNHAPSGLRVEVRVPLAQVEVESERGAEPQN
jgi:signal transduction histidine kinase